MGERHERMRQIDQKHFGQCIDQVWGENRRTLIERMVVKGTNCTAVVVKQFEARVPSSTSSKPWPELSGVWVYVPIEDKTGSWDELDERLAAFRETNKA